MRHGQWYDAWNHDMIWFPSHMRTPNESSLRPFLGCRRPDFHTNSAMTGGRVMSSWNMSEQPLYIYSALLCIVQTWPYSVCFSTFAIPTQHQCMAYTQGQNQQLHRITTWNFLKDISRSHFDMARGQLFTESSVISCPYVYSRRGLTTWQAWVAMLQWPGLWVQCYSYFSLGTSTHHPATDRLSLLVSKALLDWTVFHFFAHSHDNNMIWHCCFNQGSDECITFDLCNWSMLWIRYRMLNDAVVGENCLFVHRFPRIGELSTLQQSIIARRLKGIWSLGRLCLWRF